MHIGYCKVYRSCFRTFGAKVVEIFILMIRQFHRNEISWNFRSRGTKVPWERTKVPRERMFHGTKVPGTFAPEERKFQGANVPWNESSLYDLFAPGNESAEERKGLESKNTVGQGLF